MLAYYFSKKNYPLRQEHNLSAVHQFSSRQQHSAMISIVIL